MLFGFLRVPAMVAGVMVLTSFAGLADPLPQINLSRPHALPSYPDAAKRAGQGGTTVVAVHVNEIGKPFEVVTATSSGTPALDNAAVDAVKRWRFVPAERDGTDITEWTAVGFTFGPEGVAQVEVSPDTEVARQDRNRMVCRAQPTTTGSHLKAEPVCKPSWEWDEIARQTKDTHVRFPSMPTSGQSPGR
jgi:TonB family protein